MSWILDHLQLVIVIGGAIAYWINQRAREKSGESADYDADGIPERPSAHDVSGRHLDAPAEAAYQTGSNDADERVRRIQEEIRRKIAERRGQISPPAAGEHVPAAGNIQTRYVEAEREVPPPIPVVVSEVEPHYDDTAALERQRKLAEQMEELEQRRLEAHRLARSSSDAARSAAAASSAYEVGNPRGAQAAGNRVGLSAELRDPRALRRAMVLREVLGAPVALR